MKNYTIVVYDKDGKPAYVGIVDEATRHVLYYRLESLGFDDHVTMIEEIKKT